MNQPAVAQPKVRLAQSSPTVGTFRERDGALEWSGRQETVRIEPWGPDAVRVRARLGGPVLEGLPGALLHAPAAQDETVGISAGEARLTVGALTVEVTAEGMIRHGRPPAPRPVLERGLAGADFDEQSGVAIVDRTKTAGDAVTPAHGGTAELAHRFCDFGAGVREVTARVAGEGTVELSLDGGPVLATLTLDTPTDGPYAYTDLTAGLVADGVHDVRLRLRGPLRLAHVGFSG